VTGEDGGGSRGFALPASFEQAWGRRERPSKGPRPGLSLERIVAAGVAVAKRDGLAAVSMNRVAAEIGSSAMSLYRYIAAKDELLALMIDLAMDVPPPGPDPADGWRPAMAHWAWSAFAAYHRHPWVVRVPITGPPVTPNQIVWMEAGLRSLGGTGLTEDEKLNTMLLVSGYVRNQALMAADFMAAGLDAKDAAENYGRTLARLIDPEQFPAVHAAIASGSLDDEPDPPDADQFAPDQFASMQLSFGLDRILDGVDLLITTRRHPPP
jgi:AcrR family transcriptional regulator